MAAQPHSHLTATQRLVHAKASWMIVSATLFEAYLECPTKCWLRFHAEPAASNTYTEWARAQNSAYYERESKRLLAIIPEHERAAATSISRYTKETTWLIAANMALRANSVESRLQLVEKVPSRGQRQPLQFFPHRFEFANKLTKSYCSRLTR
jgi:hypothetical protein